MSITRKRTSPFEEAYIIEATDSGYTLPTLQMAISNIAKNELIEDMGEVEPVQYVTRENLKNILVAISDNRIVGFLITVDKKPDTNFVAYLAVDSMIKSKGVGTKLMLTAMVRTQELGKRYLALEYTHGGNLNPERSKAKIAFYNSFPKKFGIPKRERGNKIIHTEKHVFPTYDLKGVKILI